jgi:hypothetical protein
LVEDVEIPLLSDDIKTKIGEITKEIVIRLEKNQDAFNLEQELDGLIKFIIDNNFLIDSISTFC